MTNDQKKFLKTFKVGYKVLNSVFVLLVLASCSKNISQFMTDKSEMFLYNGYFNGEAKDTQLRFDRYSWTKEYQMFYDYWMASITEESPYFQWFTQEIKREIRECAEFYVTFAYTLDSRFISHRSIAKDIELQGGVEYTIPGFEKALKLHPIWQRQFLQRHKFQGVCFKRPILKPVFITIPGFEKVRVLK